VLDVELLTGSTIQTLSLNGKAGASTDIGAVSNVAAGVGLSIAGDNSGTGAAATSIGVKGAAAGATDAFTITFAGAAVSGADAVAANIKSGLVVVNGVETVNVVSAGGTNTWNSLKFTDDSLQTLNITGSKNLDVTFAGTNGTNSGSNGGAVKSIDGSAATGALNINTANVTADNAVGLTVKGGSAADTITLATKATVIAGAGDDTIVSAAGGGTFTGGAGKDTFDVSLAKASVAAGVVTVNATITDLASTDIVKFDVNAASFAATKVALDASVTNLDQAFAFATGAVGTVQWFQYGGSTYIVENSAVAGIDSADIVVKLTGTLDLSTATFDATAHTLAIV
jgi:S-layer protein